MGKKVFGIEFKSADNKGNWRLFFNNLGKRRTRECDEFKINIWTKTTKT